MINWNINEYEEPELAKIDASREIAEQLERFNNFVKKASVGGIVMTIIYFGLRIYGVL